MCGIVFLEGSHAVERLPTSLELLKHRGPDDTRVWVADNVVLGFNRLQITGNERRGRQPYSSDDWVCAVNGEIYNYQELIRRYKLKTDSDCDTDVVLPLFRNLGSSIINVLDGFYSGVIFNNRNRALYLIRDYVGKKPLFFGCSGTEFFITSELKAIQDIDWFRPVPRGLSRVDIAQREIVEIHEHKFKKSNNNLVQTLTEAVRKRLPPSSKPVGLFLSGGLDSSIIASIASKYRQDITYFTLGGKSSADHDMASKLGKFLGLNDVRIVAVPSGKNIEKYINAVVYATESFNPSIVSNGLATYLLAKSARSAGIKVVLTGEGADELFGGYYSYLDPKQFQESRRQLISDMYFTELRRLDLSTMAHSVEARCPFLDQGVYSCSENLKSEDVYNEKENKVILRDVFRKHLPHEIIERPKTSFDVGSGIRGLVVDHLRRNGRSEREELRSIWQSLFSNRSSDMYYHSYPAFDDAIERRGKTHR